MTIATCLLWPVVLLVLILQTCNSQFCFTGNCNTKVPNVKLGEGITCFTGYGQRGLLYESSVEYSHTCMDSTYCFEFYTKDIKVISGLIAYAWDEYYYEYFVRGCGGDYGTIPDWHPHNHVKGVRYKGVISYNLTFDQELTGEGGTAEMLLAYTCRQSFCTRTPLEIGNSAFPGFRKCSAFIYAFFASVVCILCILNIL